MNRLEMEHCCKNILVCSLFISISDTIGNRNVLILLADDAGLESPVFGNDAIYTPHLTKLANRGTIFRSAFTSVSSCSPSRAAVLTGLPSHQNGMYGLHNGYHHFSSFSAVKSLPNLLSETGIITGIIGKKHVGPASVYKFNFEETEENNSILQVGRNITRIKELVGQFLNNSRNDPFFLYVGFHDPHRCGHTHPEFGEFCEKFGNGDTGMGYIPDWTPYHYNSSEVKVPYFVQDTFTAREDISAQYTTISRLDQGIGLVLEELKKSGKERDTLVIYSSDNGIPFPAGRTNAYDPGIREPFIIYSPLHNSSHGKKSGRLVSLLDITPTVLDWFNVTYPQYHIINKRDVTLTGESLLSQLEAPQERNEIFISQNLHEVTMYYPMRAIRKNNYKLIHNINYKMPFPIDQDFYISNVFQEILEKTLFNESLNWYKTLETYYYRPEWELYDLGTDMEEDDNLIGNADYRDLYENLRDRLHQWQNQTDDPWLCAPHAVLQDSGQYKYNPTCFPLFNYIK